MSALDPPADERRGALDLHADLRDEVIDGPTSIDWTTLDGPLDATVRSGPADAPLLAIDEPLDPARFRVDIPAAYPERFAAAEPIERDRLRLARLDSPTPDHWVEYVNPPDPITDGRGQDRLENCCECARAFQETLEGSPRVAAKIAPQGLGLDGCADAPGESSAYTEQWAGRRFESTTYDEIARRVEETRGSAIVHASPESGGLGHAFNAFWDAGTERVRWADAQAGVVGDWPPGRLAERFPRAMSVTFPRGHR